MCSACRKWPVRPRCCSSHANRSAATGVRPLAGQTLLSRTCSSRTLVRPPLCAIHSFITIFFMVAAPIYSIWFLLDSFLFQLFFFVYFLHVAFFRPRNFESAQICGSQINRSVPRKLGIWMRLNVWWEKRNCVTFRFYNSHSSHSRLSDCVPVSFLALCCWGGLAFWTAFRAHFAIEINLMIFFLFTLIVGLTEQKKCSQTIK